MNKFILFFFIILVSCGPVIKTTYLYEPPDSEQGIDCTNTCHHSLHKCKEKEKMWYQRCQYRARLDYNYCLSRRNLFRTRGNRRRSSAPYPCYRQFCPYPSYKRCDLTYNNCYVSCGGSFETINQCVDRCEEPEDEKAKKEVVEK